MRKNFSLRSKDGDAQKFQVAFRRDMSAILRLLTSSFDLGGSRALAFRKLSRKHSVKIKMAKIAILFLWAFSKALTYPSRRPECFSELKENRFAHEVSEFYFQMVERWPFAHSHATRADLIAEVTAANSSGDCFNFKNGSSTLRPLKKSLMIRILWSIPGRKTITRLRQIRRHVKFVFGRSFKFFPFHNSDVTQAWYYWNF